jgi:hypothetical protein
MVFSDLWARRAVKTTLAPKFGGPAQKWGRAGLGKGGAGGPGLGGGGAWVGSMHHPLPWLPPQSYAKIGSF